MNIGLTKLLADMDDSDFRELALRMQFAERVRSFTDVNGIPDDVICQKLKVSPEVFSDMKNCAFNWDLRTIAKEIAFHTELAAATAKEKYDLKFPKSKDDTTILGNTKE